MTEATRSAGDRRARARGSWTRSAARATCRGPTCCARHTVNSCSASRPSTSRRPTRSSTPPGHRRRARRPRPGRARGRARPRPGRGRGPRPTARASRSWPWARRGVASSTTSPTSTSSSSPSRPTAFPRRSRPRSPPTSPPASCGSARRRPRRGRCGRSTRRCGPRARTGPLVRTVASHRAYYERWAKTWEFQALLKARPVAGDPRGRAGLLRGGPAHGVAGVVARELRRRRPGDAPPGGAAHPASRRPTASSSSGPAGLRDVEFSVQLLQLVHGRARRVAAHGHDARRARGAVGRRVRRARGRRDARHGIPAAAHAGAPHPALPAAPHAPHADGREPTCAGSVGRWGTGPRPARPSWRSGGPSSARCAGCTSGSSTGRCSRRWRGCPTPRCGSRPRRRGSACRRWASGTPAVRCATSRRSPAA